MFIYFLVLLVALVALNKYRPYEDTSLKLALQPYSGASPELYIQYVNFMDMFQKSLEPEYLYKAIDRAYELQLYDETVEFRDVIHDVALTGEEMVLRDALQKGKVFYPRYLNEMTYIKANV